MKPKRSAILVISVLLIAVLVLIWAYYSNPFGRCDDLPCYEEKK